MSEEKKCSGCEGQFQECKTCPICTLYESEEAFNKWWESQGEWRVCIERCWEIDDQLLIKGYFKDGFLNGYKAAQDNEKKISSDSEPTPLERADSPEWGD